MENGLQGVLDIAFREDASRIRKGNGDQNFSLLRRLALNLLRNDKVKAGIKAKRRRADWDEITCSKSYLSKCNRPAIFTSQPIKCVKVG